jgi:hypothetical protein
MAVHTTANKLTIERGGFPSVGPKVGLIQATIDLVTLTSANDYADVFALPAGTLVVAAGIEVVVATTNAVTVSLGLDGSSAGSRTEFSGELATNGAVGTNLAAGYAKANVMVSTADIMSLEISGDPGAAEAQVRVWAIIADTKDMA